MTELFPCCIKQFLLCQHLSWMLRMFSWCIHESCFAMIIECLAAFFETSSWLLISGILLFSLLARRGCPCLTNQLSVKAGGKTTPSSHFPVRFLVTELCREEGVVWGAAPTWQQRWELLQCCRKNGGSFNLQVSSAMGSSTRGSRGEREEERDSQDATEHVRHSLCAALDPSFTFGSKIIES